jgi:hypothetical protein
MALDTKVLDGQMERQTDRQPQNNIHPPMARDNKVMVLVAHCIIFPSQTIIK